MSNATDLAIACTMLHESIHAYLVAYYGNSIIAGNGTTNGTGFQAQYPDIAFAYSINGTAAGISHHTEMAMGGPSNGWIGDIAWSLKQYGIQQGYNLPDQFYMDMAWSGLTGTAAFTALPPADKARIKDVLATEAFGTNDHGLPATQEGTKGC